MWGCVHTHACIHVRAFACVHTCVHACVCMGVHVCVWLCVCECTCACVCACSCMCVHARVRLALQAGLLRSPRPGFPVCLMTRFPGRLPMIMQTLLMWCAWPPGVSPCCPLCCPGAPGTLQGPQTLANASCPPVGPVARLQAADVAGRSAKAPLQTGRPQNKAVSPREEGGRDLQEQETG